MISAKAFLPAEPGGVKRHIWTFSFWRRIVTVVIKTPKVKPWFIESAALPRLPGDALGYMTPAFLLSRTRPCKWIKHVKQGQVFLWKPYPFHDNPFLDIQWTYHSIEIGQNSLFRGGFGEKLIVVPGGGSVAFRKRKTFKVYMRWCGICRQSGPHPKPSACNSVNWYSKYMFAES